VWARTHTATMVSKISLVLSLRARASRRTCKSHNSLIRGLSQGRGSLCNTRLCFRRLGLSADRARQLPRRLPHLVKPPLLDALGVEGMPAVHRSAQLASNHRQQTHDTMSSITSVVGQLLGRALRVHDRQHALGSSSLGDWHDPSPDDNDDPSTQ